MAKRLTLNLNSGYLNAANSLRPGGKKKRRIVAYVESYDDIFFWKSVLSEFESENTEFEVMLPSRTNLTRGKKQAMTNELGERLGECMIACVDADYDYLMQGKTPYSKEMLSNPYIFHTYVYAIENYQCYAPSLHNVCVMSTLNDRHIFDFEQYMEQYSQIVYELFVWTVWLYRRQMYKDMPLNSFHNVISINKLNLFNPQTALLDLRKRVNRKVAYMQRTYPQAKGNFKQLKAELQDLGLTPTNTYLFVQGHHIFENVALAALDPACTLLRREREKEIKRLAGDHKQHMDNELASYQHSQCPVNQMLRRNTNFKQADMYQRLRSDLQAFVQTLETTPAATAGAAAPTDGPTQPTHQPTAA